MQKVQKLKKYKKVKRKTYNQKMPLFIIQFILIMILRFSKKLKRYCTHDLLNIKISNFCSTKNSNQDNQQSKQNNLNQSINKSHPQQQQKITFTEQEQRQINAYKPDQVFNIIMNIQIDRNLKKDLIVARKIYEKSTKQLRAAILFQDLLKTQIKILIYDTRSKPYIHQILRFLFYIFFFASSFWFIGHVQKNDPKNKIMLERTQTGKIIKFVFYTYAIWNLFRGFVTYVRFQRRFVQKIIYDTQTQNFQIVKRRFFGARYNQQISRFKLVYTQNKFLNKKGTNYFNIQTKEQYSIPYKQYWKKQDLFSHLIAQRIKL